MSRRYADPVDVRRRDDTPAAFVWCGRLYAVRAVLAHWVEAGNWWRFGSADPAGSAGSAGSAGPAVNDAEREIWRVEATDRPLAAEPAGTGVYDLCFDWSGGSWTVVRTHD